MAVILSKPLIPSKNGRISILARFIDTTSPNQTTYPGVEGAYLFHRKLPLAFEGSGFKHESLKE